MKVYLDIDGVLLDYGENPAKHAVEFLDYLVKNYEVYWLTTHCKGDCIPTQQHLSRFFTDQTTLENLKRIKPTNWDTMKTEAIDFTEPFVWIDDDLFNTEHQSLVENKATKKVILVDLLEDPDALLGIIEKLRDGSDLEPVKPNLPW